MIFVALPLTCANYYINTQTTYGSTHSNSTSSDQSPGASNDSLLDNMQLFTAANITGNGLYVHIMFEWIATCLVIIFGESGCAMKRFESNTPQFRAIRGIIKLWSANGPTCKRTSSV